MKLGEVSGIGVHIHWSFWILPVWILASALGDGGGLAEGLSAVGFVFAIFGCVVLHEFGHAFAARYFGIGTRDITLYPIGGIARLNRIPRNPLHELVIAVAGPLVNVVLAAALMALIVLGLGAGLPLGSPLGGSFLVGLMWVNIALVVFNLLPAFPMDGGRVLRAFLAMKLPYAGATGIAAKVGQGIAVALGLLGLFTGNFSLLFIALFVFLAAQAEAAMARRYDPYGGVPPVEASDAEPVMAEPVVTAEPVIWVSEVRTVDPQTGAVRIVRYPDRN